MRSRPARRRPGLLAASLLAAGMVAGQPAAAAPVPQERGYPLIRTYTPAVEEAQTQSFGIARDPQGVLYVANGGGVLVYDGAWWQAIPVGKARSAFAVASDRAGRIGVGGIDEIGYLAPDDEGSLRYVSLLGLLPPGRRQLGQVSDVHPTADGFLFMTTRWLLRWDGRTIATLATFRDERPYADSFRIGDEVYVWTPQRGLARVAGERLAPVPGGERFRGPRVDLVLPAEGGLLVSVRGEGLYRFAGGRAAPFAPEASRWAVEKKLFEGCRLPDGRWALGSVLGGLLLLRPDGTVDQAIDTAVGLPDDFVNGMVVDREGALWLALNNGIVRVEVASPISLIDRRAGLQGTAYALARHRGTLWVGTSSGVFTVAPAAGGAGPAAREWGRPVSIRAVPGLPPAVWSLLPLGDDLLVGTAFGVHAVGGGTPPAVSGAIPGTGQRTVYLLVRSAADPGRVWVGMEDGLASILHEATGWRYEGMVTGVPRDVRAIVEGEGGTVWCATMQDGVVGVSPPGSAGRRRVRRVAASDGAVLARIGGRILAVREDRLLRLDEAKGELVADPGFASLAGHGPATALAEDAFGNLWRNTRPPSVALRRGDGWAPELRSLVEVAAQSVDPIFAEPDGVVWLATENGLYRYAGSLRGRTAALPAPRLARVTAGGGTLLAGAALPGPPRVPDLAAGAGRLRIEFAPLAFRAGLRYQTRLEPLDAGWSAPGAEPFAELGRLPPGRYTFAVRTVGGSGETGPATRWAFRVRPPWYQTPWAMVLWTGAALAGLRAYGGLRGRALRQRAARLEARVAEQTVELRQSVEELRRAQAKLEAANARLEELSLQDDLTGVANRRCLQQVLEEEWSRARRQRQPLAFILLDLDHFKLLNDSRGHPEGDLCLQAVARYLAAAVRRTGDLVARYGGEEFAVLLPGTDLAGAVRVAEQLRRGIEALAIPRDAVGAGRVTASFGVAATVPEPAGRLEDLVEAADLALYRAKTEGRNRVRAEEDGESDAAPGASEGAGPLAS